MASEKEYVISASELEKLTSDASISNAIKELANMLTGRSQDLPHRFRAPETMAKYMEDWGTNSTYACQPIHGSSTANPLMLILTTRPTQKILELQFHAADGMRLFTLEIEYAIPEKR